MSGSNNDEQKRWEILVPPDLKDWYMSNAGRRKASIWLKEVAHVYSLMDEETREWVRAEAKQRGVHPAQVIVAATRSFKSTLEESKSTLKDAAIYG